LGRNVLLRTQRFQKTASRDSIRKVVVGADLGLKVGVGTAGKKCRTKKGKTEKTNPGITQ